MPSRVVINLFGSSCLLAAAAVQAAPTEPNGDLEFFEKQVRPLLAEHCYECHSARAETPEAGLLLDRRDGLVDGGDSGPALDSDDAAESLILSAVRYESFEMPPDGKLSQREIAVLERWVTAGAPWPDEPTPEARGPSTDKFDLAQRAAEHWAWQPVSDPPLPEVSDPAWPRDPLDRFILAKLNEQGLTPGDDADRPALMRRLSFALTGLPPDPDAVDDFVADRSSDALEKVVDRLLASPAFGERWARHWLDLVRYADTRGHEFDYDAPHAYLYRDYVIRALSADVPYDQFVKEQIAGDLMPEPRFDPVDGSNQSIIGTGFWHLGDWCHSPVDTRKDEADRLDNMIDVMSKTFLGVTVACARCHDHKFDAISAADYYAMSGYLQSSNYRLARIDGWRENQQAADRLTQFADDNQATLRQALAELVGARSDQLRQYVAAAMDVVATDPVDRESVVRSKAKSSSLDERLLTAWVKLLDEHNDSGSTDLLSLMQLAGGGERRKRDELPPSYEWETVVDFGQLARADWRQDGHSFGRQPTRIGDFCLESTEQGPELRIAATAAARRDPAWNGLAEIDAFRDANTSQLHGHPRAGRTLRTPTFTLTSGLLNYHLRGGCRVFVCVDSHRMVHGPRCGETMLDVPPDEQLAPRWIRHDLRRLIGHRAHIEFTTRQDDPLEIYRVVDGDSVEGYPDLDPRLPTGLESVDADAVAIHEGLAELEQRLSAGEIDDALTASAASWAAANASLIVDHGNPAAVAFEQVVDRYAAARDAIAQRIVTDSRVAMAMQDGSPEDDFLLIRGNHENPGEQIPRRFLAALGGAGPAAECTGSGRLELAEQVVDPDNPLTYRVIVNRVWAHLFGRGIVASPDDFGVLGQRPSHPELLDHLTNRFANEQNRSLKRLIRSIVLSRTYQLSSDMSSRAADVDPQNVWLSRFNVRRLEGEAIRDALIAVSGRLDTTMFGPPVPIHLTSFMQGRGRPTESGPLDGDGRRSIYLAVRRNFLLPMMTAFDAPPPSSTQGRRNASNVPAQSLILLNDPLVRQQATLWAQRIVESPHRSTAARLEHMVREALARSPSPEEAKALAAYVDVRFAYDEVDDAEVWTDVALVLLNVKEFTHVF